MGRAIGKRIAWDSKTILNWSVAWNRFIEERFLYQQEYQQGAIAAALLADERTHLLSR